MNPVPRRAAILLPLALATTLVSVLLGIQFALARPWGIRTVAALELTAASLVVAAWWRVRPGPRLPFAMLILVSAQVGLFAVTLAGSAPLASLRLLQVAAVLAYGATVLAVVLASAGALTAVRAFLVASALALGLFTAETILEVVAPSEAHSVSQREWTGSMEADPSLGRVYRPHATLKTYYPDNPRGYFEPEDQRARIWELRAMGSAAATLVLPPADSEIVRVAIEKANPDSVWQIQLEKAHLPVDSGVTYTIWFRARADQPRKLEVTFGQAHPPWDGFGMYRTVDLTPEWRSFQANVTTPIADSNTRIRFDVGASAIPVELSGATLHGPPDGRAVEPSLPPERYSVRYAFNAMGCRDRDYLPARPPGTLRILVLGDAATMGTGVHQEDTFAKQLERAESPVSGQRYEVINCGISGYSTREERLFYQRLGPAYRPDIVLLVMGLNDDIFSREATPGRTPGGAPVRRERLFRTWSLLTQRGGTRRSMVYAPCIPEILELERAARQDGARLVVAVFRNSSDPRWAQLSRVVAAGLSDSTIPIVDLGESLPSQLHDADLRVHESDRHPNELAHRAAAQTLRRFLQSQKPPQATSKLSGKS